MISCKLPILLVVAVFAAVLHGAIIDIFDEFESEPHQPNDGASSSQQNHFSTSFQVDRWADLESNPVSPPPSQRRQQNYDQVKELAEMTGMTILVVLAFIVFFYNHNQF